MKRPTKEEAIANFIRNVELDNAHEDVRITAFELLDGTEDFPIILDGGTFIDCLIAYFEHCEEYEMCGKLLKNKEEITERLVPLAKFCTANHEILRKFRNTKNKRDDK